MDQRKPISAFTMSESESLLLACPACLKTNRVPHARLPDSPNCGACGAALLDGHPATLGNESFDRFIERSGLPLLVDFWAPWCAPCRVMERSFNRAALKLKARTRFARVNSDDYPDIAARYGIRSIPTLILFRDGAEVQRVSGALDEASILRLAA